MFFSKKSAWDDAQELSEEKRKRERRRKKKWKFINLPLSIICKKCACQQRSLTYEINLLLKITRHLISMHFFSDDSFSDYRVTYLFTAIISLTLFFSEFYFCCIWNKKYLNIHPVDELNCKKRSEKNGKAIFAILHDIVQWRERARDDEKWVSGIL